MQYYPQTIPTGQGANAVNIQIFSPAAYSGQAPATQTQAAQAPTAYPPAQQPVNPQLPAQYPAYPYPYPCPCCHNTDPNKDPNSGGNTGTGANTNANNNANNNTNTNINSNVTTVPTANNPKEKIVVLTDEYIKTLENYLNNQDPKIRMQGINELLKRFKEDKSRTNDIPLTALLNKALQDKSASVRFMALTVLDVGYAKGNDETFNILTQLENQINTGSVQIGEDARLASKVLLKMSGETTEVPAGTGHNPPKPAEKTKKGSIEI